MIEGSWCVEFGLVDYRDLDSISSPTTWYSSRLSGRLIPSPIWYSSRPTHLSIFQINPSVNQSSRTIQLSRRTISSTSLSATPSTWVTPSSWPIRWCLSCPTSPTWHSQRPIRDILQDLPVSPVSLPTLQSIRIPTQFITIQHIHTRK